MDRNALRPLPSSKAFGDPWAVGWWLCPPSGFMCCSLAIEHRIHSGQPIYLTGRPGYVYCEAHASDGAWHSWARDRARAMGGA